MPGIFSLGTCMFAPIITVAMLWDAFDKKYG